MKKNKSNILLIKPEPAHNSFSLEMALSTEPLELEYIAAMLKKEQYPFYIWEASIEGPESFDHILQQFQPDYVLITGYITQEYLMLQYAQKAKAYNSEIITVIGGSHAQLNPSHFQKECIDFICRSDNIFGILSILKKEPLSSVDGLCYVKDGRWQENELKPFSINLLPLPDRTLSNKRMQHYRYLDVSPLALLKTSTSCPYQCSFCYGRSLNCSAYTVRDLDKVIEEIKTIVSPNIWIVDDDFLFDKKRLLEFVKRLKEEGIEKTFICYGRADFISKERDILIKLKEVGFRYIMVGLETANNSLLEAYQKKTSLDINIQCIKVLKKLDINIVGLFIVDIHFTSRDFRNMRRFIRQSGISYTGVSIFTPIPGTSMFEQYRDQLLTQDMEKWDFMHLVLPPVHMSRFRFYLEYYRLVMLLFAIAEKKGIYRFLTLSDYKKIFWGLIWKDS